MYILIIINIIAPNTGNTLILLTFAKCLIIKLIGIFNIKVINIPNTPAQNPIINVSALNTLLISLLDAPIALKIPISLVLSITDI